MTTQILLSWMTKVSRRRARVYRGSPSRLAKLHLSEQEEVIQTLKAENDASDRQIWFCLRLVMGCLAFLSVPISVSAPAVN
jgi:hypothetical protein